MVTQMDNARKDCSSKCDSDQPQGSILFRTYFSASITVLPSLSNATLVVISQSFIKVDSDRMISMLNGYCIIIASPYR